MKRFTAILLACSALSANATSYYFSSAGNDANSGTNSGAPWKSLTKIYQLAFATPPLSPGDSILLKAGDTFDTVALLYNGGSSGNPITITRYDTGADPIIVGDNPNAVWAAVGGHAGVYSTAAAAPATVEIVAESASHAIYTQAAAQGGSTLSDWLNTFAVGTWGFSFDTPTLVYVKTLDGNPPPQMRVIQYAAINSSLSYFNISHLNIQRVKHGIVLNDSAGTTITACSFSDTTGSSVFCAGCSGLNVSSNAVARAGYTQLYFQGGGNNHIWRNNLSVCTNTILGLAINGSEKCGIGLQQGTNNLAEYNVMDHMADSFVDWFYEVNSECRNNYGYVAGIASAPHGTGLKVHHNIWHVSGGSGLSVAHAYLNGTSPLPDSGAVKVFANVIYDATNYGLFTSGSDTNVLIEDNVFVARSNAAALTETSVAIPSDYNVFWCLSGTGGWNYNSTPYATIAALRAASGMETHSLYANPLFASLTPTTPANFTPLAGSPCLHAGVWLGIAGLVDFIGTPVPSTSPDIGAYQSVSAPRTLRVTHMKGKP